MKKKKRTIYLWEKLIGKRIGKLIVEERVYDYPAKGIYLKCQCDCGNEKIKKAHYLSEAIEDNSFQSCGCVNSQIPTRIRRLESCLKQHLKIINSIKKNLQILYKKMK